MSCKCRESEGIDLIEKFPEKRQELETYINTLGVSDDREQNRAFLIQTLHKAQNIFGYLPVSVQLFVAEHLKLHLSEVFGVISFYSYFTDVPIGKYKINICTGTACFVKGSGAVLEEFKRYLNLDVGETAKDGKFSLGGLRCVGACSLAPVVTVNGRVYGRVTTKMVPEIISDCK